VWRASAREQILGSPLKIGHLSAVAGRRAAIFASMCRAPKDSRACNWLCARQRSRMLSTPAPPNFAQGSTWSSSSNARESHRRPSGDTNVHCASSRRYTARLTAAETQRLRRLRFAEPAATRAIWLAREQTNALLPAADVIAGSASSRGASPGGVARGGGALACVASALGRHGLRPTAKRRASSCFTKLSSTMRIRLDRSFFGSR
jgi:hypothetical protein